MRMLNQRIGTIEKFVQAREALHGGDAQTMVGICNQLVDQAGVEEAIRLGDVFAQLVEFYSQKGDFKAAQMNIEKMRRKNIIITPYLDPSLVEEVYGKLGLPPPGKQKTYNDGIDEDIKEDF